MSSRDDALMAEALLLAREAGEAGEVPVGALLVAADGRVVGRGRNRMAERSDPRAHAEMEAIDAARSVLGTARLDGATLVATLEPCPMCAGAILLARVARVVFGAWDPRLGACGSRWDVPGDNPLGDVLVRSGVRGQECGALLAAWFLERRAVE